MALGKSHDLVEPQFLTNKMGEDNLSCLAGLLPNPITPVEAFQSLGSGIIH